MKKIILIIPMVLSLIVVTMIIPKASSDIVNLASPDLTNKTYLGDGVYRIFNSSGVKVDYNVYTGVYHRHGTATTDVYIPLTKNVYEYNGLMMTMQIWRVSGSGHLFPFVVSGGNFGADMGPLLNYAFVSKTLSAYSYSTVQMYNATGASIDVKFKLQLEKGNVASPFQTSVDALLQHSQLDFKRGYDLGIDDASIIGYPENLAEWYSQQLYSNYYHMTIGNIILETNRKGITVIVPDFDNVITSAGSGTEQTIVFYDAFDNEILSHSVYGRLTGRFDYSIPVGAYSFTYYVLVQGPLPQNYVYEWNKVAYVGYKDLLTTYSQAWQEGYDKGWDEGYDEGSFNGYHEGRDYGYELGKNDAIEKYKDEWFQKGKSEGYAEGLDDNVATGGFIMILSSAFIGISTLLGIELLPNITLGMIVAVPLVFGILFFILGKRKD